MPENVLGEKLKKLRKEKGLTQEKLSQKLGFSNRYISKIEAGEKPSMETFRKLAAFFQVPVEYLVSENEDTNTLSAVIRNKEVLDAFIDVDQMDSEDQKIILGVIKAFTMKNKVKTLFDVKK
ncbi:MAG: helix-turn-helix transcriptional regulator [Firmicutes bacterium]|nr:helix-turn-helix transcriptional regulator [Bacillota bacterium]